MKFAAGQQQPQSQCMCKCIYIIGNEGRNFLFFFVIVFKSSNYSLQKKKAAMIKQMIGGIHLIQQQANDTVMIIKIMTTHLQLDSAYLSRNMCFDKTKEKVQISKASR